MRHVDLNPLLLQLFGTGPGEKTKESLERALKTLSKKRTHTTRKKYVDNNGGRKWKPVKDHLTTSLGRKCWYTEVELIGAPLAIDHFRPVCDYWWLAFDPENYRVSCPWANSPEHNEKHGCAGGKGDNFPLLHPAVRATNKAELANEHPVILDPCNPHDCDLLAFEADGRPILNQIHAEDLAAPQRVEQSKILLNLDHPEFNSKREQLCNGIAEDVQMHEALPTGDAQRQVIFDRLAKRLNHKSAFSSAARGYLRFHRHLAWVDALLNTH